MMSLACVWALGLAMAVEPAEPTMDGSLSDAVALAPPTETGGAERLDGITVKEYRWLKPQRHKMDPNPYQQVDFTAYTLEWGEARVGVAGIQVGVLPRFQAGTQPVLDLIGIYNANAKLNAVRIGNLDLGVTGAYHRMPLGEFTAQYGSVGGAMSLVASKKWSVHAGAQFGQVRMEGIPTAPPAVLRSYVNQDQVEEWAAAAEAVGVDPYLRAEGVSISVATDFRFNRRDSIVLRGQAFTYGAVEANLGTTLPAEAIDAMQVFAPGIQSTSLDEQKNFGVSEAYAVTLSYQASFRRLDIRLGAGRAVHPLLSALSANDVAVRFGGETRMDERRSKRGWRKNRDDVTR